MSAAAFENLDIDRIHRIIASREEKQTIIQESSSLNVWWILLLLLLLFIIIALILVFCCICEVCPLYVPPKKRKIGSSEVTRLVFRGSGNGKQSKSVQVAEWFGRKEAWSPEQVMVENEMDSLRKHELERGSDRGGRRPRQAHQDPTRDQLYIREGNADILRLVTRGAEAQRPITLVEDQAYVVDGKDILMRRYIDQQQAEAAKVNVILPNAVQKLQSEQELLEASLRQQNALLRQILLERDLKLETQSLPAGTQTDHDACTQTEPFFMRPPRRRIRSDNDASDYSDEEDMYSSHRRRRLSRRNHMKRRIRTPILEESESNLEERSHQSSTRNSRLSYGETRASLLRQRATSNNRSEMTRSAIKREVLKEISATLLKGSSSDSEDDIIYKNEDSAIVFSDDSLDEYISQSNKNNSNKLQKYASETDVRVETAQKLKSMKSLSQIDLTSSATSQPKKPLKKVSGSRYMEWYKKNAEESAKRRQEKESLQEKPSKISKSALVTTSKDRSIRKKITKDKPAPTKDTEKPERQKSKKNSQRKQPVELSKEPVKDVQEKTETTTTKVSKKVLLADAQTGTGNGNIDPENQLNVGGPDHPLLQHSERRFEIAYPRKPEEDGDSGIALTRPPIAQKKSVFTIAYDDMHTKQLRPESSASPPPF